MRDALRGALRGALRVAVRAAQARAHDARTAHDACVADR
jgi:hypothetical protein